MISIVIPVFNEQENLPLLYERLSLIVDQMAGYQFEFVFIDDYSTDRSFAILEDLRRSDARVQFIRFARNCGAHAAIAAGLKFCVGRAAIKMAADLQDPPELIPRLVEQWEKGYKVVWGKRTKRLGEKFITLAFSRVFYFLMNRLTNIKQPSQGADVTLLDRKVIDALVRCSEKNASNNMLIAWLGFSQTYIEYTKQARHAGISKWTLGKRVKLFIDSLISFSYIPLRLMSILGIALSVIGVLFSLRVFFNALLNRVSIEGWSSLMIVVLFIGGFQMIMMGILGEYLWRAYDEIRRRPMYVIDVNTISEEHSNRDQKNSID